MPQHYLKSLCICMLALSPLVTANVLPNNSFNGFYAGIAAGGSFTSGRENTLGGGSHLFSDFVQTFVSTTSSRNDLIDNALKGAVYAGYGHTWQLFYLSAEIFADISNYNMRSSGGDGFKQILSPVLQIRSAYSTKVTLNPIEYGIDLRPGILLGPDTLLYGRIGTAINQLSLDSNVNGTEEQFPPIFVRETFGGTFPFSTTKTRAALRLGLGIEQHISPQLAVHADYIYTDYGKITIDSSATQSVISADSGPVISTISSNSNVKVTNNSVLLGLSYYFNDCSPNNVFDPLILTTNVFNGIYAGVSVGGSFTSGSVAIFANSLVNSNSNFQNPYSGSSNLSKDALKGALFAGYGHSWDAFYLGAEVFGDLSQYAMKHFGRERFFQIQPPAVPILQDLNTLADSNADLHSGEFGADLRSGILLSPTTLIYGRIGVTFNRLSLDSSTATFIQFFPGTGFVPEIISLKSDFSASEKRSALRLGGGIEQHLNSHFAVRADYIYTDYGKINTSGMTIMDVNSPNLGPTHIALVNQVNLHVRNNTAMLGLVYYFASNGGI